jgi:hypothetical protein
MLLDSLEKIRKQPLEVRRQVMFLVTIVVAMVVTVLWALGYFLTSELFYPEAAKDSSARASQVPAADVISPGGGEAAEGPR